MNIKQRGELGAYQLSCGCRLGCCRHSHQLGSEVRLQPYLTSLPTLTLSLPPTPSIVASSLENHVEWGESLVSVLT